MKRLEALTGGQFRALEELSTQHPGADESTCEGGCDLGWVYFCGSDKRSASALVRRGFAVDACGINGRDAWHITNAGRAALARYRKYTACRSCGKRSAGRMVNVGPGEHRCEACA